SSTRWISSASRRRRFRRSATNLRPSPNRWASPPPRCPRSRRTATMSCVLARACRGTAGRRGRRWWENTAAARRAARAVRFVVQGVSRPNGDFRGYAGFVASGAVEAGDAVLIARSGQRTRVARILTFDGDLLRAETGSAVTLTLADQVDLARGDVLAHPET